MCMSGKQWEIPYRPTTAEEFTGTHPPLLEAVLALRGITPADAEAFLQLGASRLGASRIVKAVKALEQNQNQK